VRQWKVVLAALLVGSVMIGMWGLALQAQVRSPWPVHEHEKDVYQYSAKVVQGTTPSAEVLGPGQYSTSINIHNPWCYSVDYQVKLAVSGVDGNEYTITLFQPHTLTPDGATEFGRTGFATLMSPVPLPGFLEGYFVIESEQELDVVAVYSGNALGNGELSTMETERVPARRVPRGQDYGAYIGTCLVPWQITSVPPSSPCTGAMTNLSVGQAPCSSGCTQGMGWVTPPAAGVTSGVAWVGTSNCDGTAGGDYTYVYTFQLCCNFYSAEIHFQLWADNSSDVYLNNSPVLGSTMDNANSMLGLTISITQSQWFRVGLNTLRIVVHNRNSSGSVCTATGMMLDGWLFAEAALGNCP
jgi:hypothetical protein